VPGVAYLQQRQLLDVRVDDLGEPPQQPSPVGRCYCAPRRQGRVRAGDRMVGLLGAGQLNGRHQLLGGRVDHVV
jgi:hypothetical protein